MTNAPWISINDRVPKIDQPVIYWFDPKLEGWTPAAFTGKYLGVDDGLHGFGGPFGFNYGPEVTHWIDLDDLGSPEPPSQEKTNV